MEMYQEPPLVENPLEGSDSPMEDAPPLEPEPVTHYEPDAPGGHTKTLSPQESPIAAWEEYLTRSSSPVSRKHSLSPTSPSSAPIRQRTSCYNPPNFSFYSLPQATSGPSAPPAPTTQAPQIIPQPAPPPSVFPRAHTPTLPTTFSQEIPAIPITWPTHTCDHSSMEYFIEPIPTITDPATESDGDSPMRDRSPSPPYTPYLLGTHYGDVVGHDNGEGLKVTDPQRSTTSSLKEKELRS